MIVVMNDRNLAEGREKQAGEIGGNLLVGGGVLWDISAGSNWGEGKGLAQNGDRLLRSARFQASHGG